MLGESPFNSPRLLVADARDDIYRLNEIVGNFVKGGEHTHSGQLDPEQPFYTHSVQFKGTLPANTTVLLRRAATSLRSALDQTVYASAVMLQSGNLSATKFPFGDTEVELEGDIKRKCRGVDPAIIVLIRTFKPHKGGNFALWGLNKLRNINEHRLLVPSAFGGGVQYETEIAGKRVTGTLTPPVEETSWDAVNKKLTFKMFRVVPFPIHSQVKPALFITFGDIEGLRGQHVIPTLRDAETVVTSIINGIEAETQRLVRERL